MSDTPTIEERLTAGLAELGCDPAGGPEDADICDKALFLLRGLFSERDTLSGQLAGVTAERDTLTAALDKATGAYQVRQRRSTGKGRKTALLPIGDAEKREQLRADIAQAIEGEVELVFSDGKREITGIDPMIVTGAAAWAAHPVGMMLRDRVTLNGPAAREGSFTVAGVGLYVDGEQLAWCQFHDPVVIAGGSVAELRDTIIF